MPDKITNQGEVIKEVKTKNILTSCCSISGEATAYEFHRQYDDELKREKVVRGEAFDLTEFIAASSSATDFAMLREQYARTGQLPGDQDKQYGVDELLFPENIHELNNIYVKGRETFMGLPDNIRAAFGGDYEKYLQACLKGNQNQIIVDYYQQQAQLAQEQLNKEKDGNENAK